MDNTSQALSHDRSANEIDNWVDDAVLTYLDPEAFKSFFLFAGAGSGKTRTLVNVLSKFKEKYGQQFRLKRQKVAIITYTNAAADEITHRLEHHSIFQVSTIHSFAWELIKPFTHDIRDWLRSDLTESIAELTEEQGKSRNLQNKTSIDRARKIESKTKRLESLDAILKFTYNPNGDNITRDSLNHTEVISMAADFIKVKPLMQRLVVGHFPIILIDESQDTKKELIDAIFSLQQTMPETVCVGLFGDTMQRIYADGKENLEKSFPKSWEVPNKMMNHRSTKRIITLINNIREEADGQKQQPREDKQDGTVRLFICERGGNKTAIEETATRAMAELTGDTLWNMENDNVKTLILEHHMAAKRMGFFEFFEPLYRESKFATGLLDGSLSGISLFSNTILPLLKAHREKDQFEIARIVRKESHLFDPKELKTSADQLENLRLAKIAIEKLLKLWDNNNDPPIIDVLQSIHDTGIFLIPASIYPIVARTQQEKQQIATENVEDTQEDSVSELEAWESALSHPFSQVIKYNEYLSDKSKFGTHQGVKGLEYPRVMVIIDDDEAKGFMFSYDKLFGSKELTANDKKNIAEGKETGIERTRRLFYVACSRARESLAIVAYTDNPGAVRLNALKNKWFDESEIELL